MCKHILVFLKDVQGKIIQFGQNKCFFELFFVRMTILINFILFIHFAIVKAESVINCLSLNLSTKYFPKFLQSLMLFTVVIAIFISNFLYYYIFWEEFIDFSFEQESLSYFCDFFGYYYLSNYYSVEQLDQNHLYYFPLNNVNFAKLMNLKNLLTYYLYYSILLLIIHFQWLI